MSKSKLDFVLDVDGVLTDGTFLYDENGKVLKSFGPHDSFMLNKIKDRLNIHFISADHRGFKITTQRVEDMGFKVTLVNEKDRVEYIENNFQYESLIYMGDGDIDAKLIEKAYIGIAPINSRQAALNVAKYVTKSIGGQGAVAEAVDFLIDNNIV